MQKQKCSLNLYTNFLISNHNRYSGAELERVTPVLDMHHDAVSRWLANSKYTPSDLWNQVQKIVRKGSGYLVCDDSLLDKRFSRKNELAHVQYSGNEHGLVNGISLVNLLWTDAEEIIPVDYRVYDRERDDKTKNDHFQDMLNRAKKRGFSPKYVLMDAWYGSIENLKHIRKLDWHFMTNLKSNRQVSIAKNVYVAVSDLDFADEQAKKVWLKEYGYVLVRRIVATNGDTTHVATSDLSLTGRSSFLDHWQHRWNIEEFHRGIKQTTGIEKCYSTKASSQKTHIFASFAAFIKLEVRRLRDKISWYEQKASISRSATTFYLANA